ncbi:MAG: glutaredoxin domain-containing protein [Desulfuromonadales bacterium]
MTNKLLSALAIILAMTLSVVAAEQPHQSTLNPSKAAAAKQYPRIVLYSVSWCPHCRETKEYLTKNDIPFINRDVEIDTSAMEELTGKYNSTGVPVIVFGTGKNEVVMKGFTPELFQESLKSARAKR